MHLSDGLPVLIKLIDFNQLINLMLIKFSIKFVKS